MAVVIGVGVIAFAIAAPAHAQRRSETAVIPTDPAVRMGRLPNGLRYALMTNDRPDGGLSVRLRFDVGSYEEPDGHLGVAHFLEHMAFNGTRSINEGELTRRFAEAGVTFGRDQNATTSAFVTTYMIDLPSTEPAALDLTFAWLRDIGDGLLLEPEAVERERGVIMAEHNSSLGPAKAWSDAYQAFAAPTARSRTRPPIGRPETIRAIDADALTAFHRAWYRPDNAVLIIVGDLPLSALESRVRRTFGSWTAPAEIMVRAQATPFDLQRQADVLIYPDASLTSSISLCRLSAWKALGPDTRARRRLYITQGLWAAILNRRLQLLSQGADAPFAAASVYAAPWTRETEAVCLNVTPPVDGDWRTAFSAALTEIRRLEAHGVDAPEIARVVEAQKRANRTGLRQSDDRFSQTLASSLLGVFPPHDLDPTAFIRPRDTVTIYDEVVAGIDAESIRTAFGRAWSGSSPLIAVRMPQPPNAEEVHAVWTEAMSAPEPAARPQADDLAGWAYSDFGAPGVVVSRETIAQPGFTRVHFENGVVLNVKSVDYTHAVVQMSVEFGSGRSGLPDSDFQAASFGAGFLYAGGLGAHSLREIQDLFPEQRLNLGVRILKDAFQIYGATPPRDLELQLQLTAALLTDPGFRDDVPAQRKQTIDTVYRAFQTQPYSVLNQAIGAAVAPDNPRLLPPRAQMDALTMADIERIYRPVLTEAPLEVTIVGDMSEARMIDLVAGTLGALPRREATPDSSKAFLLRYGEARPRVEARHDGAADQVAISAVWPLFVSDPSRRREQRAMELLRVVLQEQIRDKIREALGASYAPSVGLRFEDGGDDGGLFVNVLTSPADAERVQQAIRQVVAKVSAGEISQAELDNARTPILARVRETRATTGWWYGVLSGSARDPQKLRDAVEWESEYRNMTLDELKAAAAVWLSGPPIEGAARPNVTVSPN